jgi:hypothetical protein
MKNNPTGADAGEFSAQSEVASSRGTAVSPNPEAERLALKNKAQIALLIGLVSVALGWLIKLPIGAIALFMGIQAEAGLLRLEASEGRKFARAAIISGGAGFLMFLAALAYNLWPLLSRSR